MGELCARGVQISKRPKDHRDMGADSSGQLYDTVRELPVTWYPTASCPRFYKDPSYPTYTRMRLPTVGQFS